MDIAGTVTGIVIGGGLLALFTAIFWSDIRRPIRRSKQPDQRTLDEERHGMGRNGAGGGG